MTTPTTSAGFPTVDPTTLPSSSTTSTSQDQIPLDKNAFLQMLVAQLKYQNPMSPTDGTQYMAQMAQFAMVEALQNIETAQTQATTWQQALTGENMVGKYVKGVGAAGTVVTGLVTGIQLGSGTPTLTLKDGSTISAANVATVSVDPLPADGATNTATSNPNGSTSFGG